MKLYATVAGLLFIVAGVIVLASPNIVGGIVALAIALVAIELRYFIPRRKP